MTRSTSVSEASNRQVYLNSVGCGQKGNRAIPVAIVRVSHDLVTSIRCNVINENAPKYFCGYRRICPRVYYFALHAESMVARCECKRSSGGAWGVVND